MDDHQTTYLTKIQKNKTLIKKIAKILKLN